CRARPDPVLSAPTAASVSTRLAFSRGAAGPPLGPVAPSDDATADGGCRPAHRPDVDAVFEPQIDVVDVAHLFPKSRCQTQIVLHPREKPVLTHIEHGAVPVEDDAGIVWVRHVHL